MPHRVFVQKQREKLLAKQALYDFELERAHHRRKKKQSLPSA
ncbi:unnamed protein product [Soboliphyme baturini]|uniref:Transposase n=1 Tax=Soboliphyme baturini TaxID=241478 RepID=A0A183IQ07_9BILA|nr:unnamed protein product [Soboliphyme baturini]